MREFKGESSADVAQSQQGTQLPLFVVYFASHKENVDARSTFGAPGCMMCPRYIMESVKNLHFARLGEIPAFSTVVSMFST